MGMAEDIIKDLHDRIARTHDAFRQDLLGIRTGRANLHLLDGIKVDYYGQPTPLNQVSTLSVADARLITCKPWEKNMIPVIEKAIRDANLGLNPQSDKDLVRVPIPPLTEERRKELVKHVKRAAEEHKVGVRDARRDALAMLKDLEGDGLPADEKRRAEKKVQDFTDEYVKKIDQLIQQKEQEILQV
jgi:ribosome recycling factor